MSRGTCFVVSPALGNDSPEMKRQNETLKRLIQSVCTNREVDLDPIRAVDISDSGEISDDVLNHLREDAFCLVDLTGLDPNVMYGLGIRVQTGLPFITFAQKGQALPFEKIAQRTLFFEDIGMDYDKRDAFEDVLKESVSAILEKGTGKPAESVSNNEIMAGIVNLGKMIKGMKESASQSPSDISGGGRERIDNDNNKEVKTETAEIKAETGKAEKVTAPSETAVAAEEVKKSEETDILKLIEENDMKPKDIMTMALQSGNVEMLDKVLQSFPNLVSEYSLLAGTSIGSVYCADNIEKDIDGILASNNIKKIINTIGSLCNCFVINNLNDKKFEVFSAWVDKAVALQMSNKQKATVLAQKGRMLAGTDKLDDSIKLAEQIITLDEEESEYFFDAASLISEKNAPKDKERLITLAKKMLDLDKAKNNEDVNHLTLACKILRSSDKNDDKNRAENILKTLKKIAPESAAAIISK